jgi:murein DD-endopeptidase MepM/ murein hydrolase activator NlpD
MTGNGARYDQDNVVVIKAFHLPTDKDDISDYDEINIHKTNPTVFDEYLWPVPASTNISSYYGNRTHPITGEPEKFHDGIDIVASYGTPIYAIAPGTAIMKDNGSVGYGKIVLVSHDKSVQSGYGHCSSFVSNISGKVKRGQIIAYVGSTGQSTGNHLHLLLNVNGKPADPLGYFDNRDV